MNNIVVRATNQCRTASTNTILATYLSLHPEHKEQWGLVFACAGPLDAPTVMHAGSVVGDIGEYASIIYRGE